MLTNKECKKTKIKFKYYETYVVYRSLIGVLVVFPASRLAMALRNDIYNNQDIYQTRSQLQTS